MLLRNLESTWSFGLSCQAEPRVWKLGGGGQWGEGRNIISCRWSKNSCAFSQQFPNLLRFIPWQKGKAFHLEAGEWLLAALGHNYKHLKEKCGGGKFLCQNGMDFLTFCIQMHPSLRRQQQHFAWISGISSGADCHIYGVSPCTEIGSESAILQKSYVENEPMEKWDPT